MDSEQLLALMMRPPPTQLVRPWSRGLPAGLLPTAMRGIRPRVAGRVAIARARLTRSFARDAAQKRGGPALY